jgi:hypothetical protein
VNAILNKQRVEAISSILYPDDRTYQVMLFYGWMIKLACSMTQHLILMHPKVQRNIKSDLAS